MSSDPQSHSAVMAPTEEVDGGIKRSVAGCLLSAVPASRAWLYATGARRILCDLDRMALAPLTQTTFKRTVVYAVWYKTERDACVKASWALVHECKWECRQEH